MKIELQIGVGKDEVKWKLAAGFSGGTLYKGEETELAELKMH